MTTLSDRIAAHSRRPTATVRLSGQLWRDVLSLSRSQQYGQGISGGQVSGRNPPNTIVEGETRISWSWGYDGYEVAGFSGVVTKILQKSYPNRWLLQVADPLWLADIRRKDYTASPINDCLASDAVEQFLGSAGLTRLSIPALAASGSAWAGSEWVMGRLTPVAFANTTALQASVQVCQALGYWLYCDAAGVARATLLERRPSDSPFRTLRWGEDFLLAGPPERERDAAQVKNRIVVRGANTGVGGAQIWDAWQTGDADRTLEVTYALIEYVNESEAGAASCTGAAKRLLRLWDRDPNVIHIPRLKADPRLGVGQTVAIECAPIGYSSATPFFIYSLETRLDLPRGDFSQSLVLDGGVGDQGYTTVPPPVAAFSWRLVAETLDGVAVVEVFLDGSGSQSFGGEIVSWAWESATAVESGYSDTASGVRAMFVYPAATTSADITLTVTDTSSKTGSITQTISLAGDAFTPVNSRVISLALGAAWAVSPDGGQTWNVEASGDSTLVPEVGGAQLLSTRATGSTGLRGSSDALASASVTLASLGGQITALSATDGYPLRVWAAVGASLSRSTDGGATFALWGTLPATVNAVLEDPAVLNSVFVLAGADMYHATTETPGSAWSVLYAGPSGATARHLVRGASGATTWIAYTDAGGGFVGSPLQRVEGPISATWDVGVSPQPTEIRAIALSSDELTVYAWDGEGRGWAVDSATGIASAITATLDPAETAQHALHDPDDPIVYLATFGSTEGTTYKYLPLADKLAPFYAPAAGQQAHRIGLGAPPAPSIEFILLPYHGSGADDFLRHYRDGAFTTIAPPRASWYWLWLAANPFNPDEWLLFGTDSFSGSFNVDTGIDRITSLGTSHSPLYRTTDAGATWTEVILDPSLSTNEFTINQVEFDAATGGNWFAYGYGTVAGLIWRGSGDAAPGVELLAGAGSLYMAAGRAGDGVLAGVAKGMAYLPVGASALTVVAATGAINGAIDLTASIDRAIVRGADAGYSADYRAAGLVSQSTTNQRQWVACAADGIYLSGGGADGIVRVTDPASWDATASVVAGAGVPASFIRSDRQARVSVAARVSGAAYTLVYDGATWGLVPDPAGLTAGTIADRVEVIRRSA